MPTEYIPQADQMEVTCSHCQRSWRYSGGWRIDAGATTTDGTRIADEIRFLPARGRFHSWCRECERGLNRNRSRRAPRVPGTRTGRLATRKFGVELEVKVPRTIDRARITAELTAAGLGDWRCKGDGSISGWGFEVVSPPLSGEAGFDKLRTACQIIRRLGGTVDRSCGTHVHHDIRDLTIDQVKQVARSWANSQDIIDGLVAPSRRDGSNSYCRRLQPSELAALESVTSLSQIGGVMGSRYKTLNLQAYGRYGTVEIRQHQGTIDFEKIRTWVLLGQAIIDTAKNEQIARPSTVRQLLDALGEMLDETAATFTIGRAVQFAHVAV